MLALASCGSKSTSGSESANTDNEKSIIDVFFKQQDSDKKQYLNRMLKKYDSKVNVSEFEFTLKEVINESNMGYCFCKVNIKSDTIPVSEMFVEDAENGFLIGPYLMRDSKYSIQITSGTNIIMDQINTINDNEVEAFLFCTGRSENEDISIQVWEEDENDKKLYKGDLKVDETKNAIKFDINEDSYCWVGPFGIRSIYPNRGLDESKPFGQAEEVSLVMNDGSTLVVYSIDKNINTGYSAGSDGTTTYNDYNFEEIVDVSNIKSLKIDDDVYEISDVSID